MLGRHHHPARRGPATLLLAALALSCAGPGETWAQEPPPAPPLRLTIEPSAVEPPASRLEQLLARQEERARRLRVGICRGCARSEAAPPSGQMIEVSVARPRASWEVVEPR